MQRLTNDSDATLVPAIFRDRATAAQAIEALQRELANIRVRLRELGDPAVDEKPPHY